VVRKGWALEVQEGTEWDYSGAQARARGHRALTAWSVTHFSYAPSPPGSHRLLLLLLGVLGLGSYPCTLNVFTQRAMGVSDV
jgi:hypothetical protein